VLETVYSGGQTGADRAALEAAKELQLTTGGWAPAGYHTTAGPDLALKAFGLREVHGGSLARRYVTRSIRNVDDTDGTLVVRLRPGRGTDKTLGYCWTGKWQLPPKALPAIPFRPVLAVKALDDDALGQVEDFLLRFGIKRLNVAGHRNLDPARAWQKQVQAFLQSAFAQALHK
jgi:hypothetical protein